MTTLWSRREWLGGVAGGVLGASATLPTGAALANSAGATAVKLFDDPQAELEAVVRVMGDSAGRQAPWWYTGHIYGVMPGEAPKPLVRFEGAEINLFVRQADSAFRQTGTTTTYYQDISTGEVLQEFMNPYTAARNAVRPNKLGGSGYVVWSRDGVEPVWRAFGKLAPKKLAVYWTVFGATVWMRHDRVFPPQMPQPIYEASTSIVSRRDLMNTRKSTCPAQFSSSYVARWPAWMQMGDSPGHVLWHADGLKLEDTDALPAEYLRRVRADFPEQLTVPPPPS
jgi:hypothetical protein